MVDGEPVYKEEILTNGQPVNAQMWAIGAQIQRGYWMDYRYEWQWTAEAAREGIELYDQHELLVDQFLGVAFTEEEQQIYDRYWPSIRTYMLERQQAWVLGTGDIQEDWGDYVKTLNKMGYDKVIEVLNTAYQRQYS